MYISKIHIQNYRNFDDFTIEFHKGLNVIIGANNSGKTGLLHAINLLDSSSDISVNDFNKNLLLQYPNMFLLRLSCSFVFEKRDTKGCKSKSQK